MRARAAVAAALAGVDYVLADGAIPAGSEIFDLDGDGAREQFLEHVRRRHNGAGS